MLHKRRGKEDRCPASGAKKAAAIEAAVDVGPLDEIVGYLVRRAQIAVYQRLFELFAEVIERNPGVGQTQLPGAAPSQRPHTTHQPNAER